MLAHQYIDQLEEEVRDAVVGKRRERLSLFVWCRRRGIFEKEFAPEISALDLVNLPNQKFIWKLMIDGATPAFFPPIPCADIEAAKELQR